MQEIYNDAEPLKNRLLRNGFWMYILTFFIAPAGYLIKLIVSRELSVEDVGLVYSIIWFIGLLAAFNDFGLTEALQYYLPHYIIDKEYGKAKAILYVTRIVQFIGWAIIWWILYFTAPWFAEHYFHSPQATEILRIFCFYFLFINLFQVLSSVFIALQNIKLQYITEAIRLWIIVGCLGYFMFTSFIDIKTFSILRLVSVIIWVIVSLFFFFIYHKDIIVWKPIEFDLNTLKIQWSYAWKVMIAIQAWLIYGSIGQQFAISFLWPFEAWIRSNYMTFFTIIWVITWPVLTYIFPLFTELYKKKEQEKINLMKKYLVQWLIIWSLWIGVWWRFFSERAAGFIFTNKFIMSGTLFKRNSLFFFFTLATWIQWSILAWAWYVKERMQIIVFWTIFSLILSYIWVLNFGLYGLMGSLVITYIYFCLHSLWYIKKFRL